MLGIFFLIQENIPTYFHFTQNFQIVGTQMIDRALPWQPQTQRSVQKGAQTT